AVAHVVRDGMADAIADAPGEIQGPVGDAVESGHRGVPGRGDARILSPAAFFPREPRARRLNGRSARARLRPVGGGRRPRVFRPRMLRVTALHFFAHLRVGALPEAAEIAGDLQ